MKGTGAGVIDDSHRELMERHLDLVIEANRHINLTRITSREEAQLLHIEDSLVGLPELMEAPDGRYADIGTGAGFPGMPLAIVSGRRTTLIDTRAKKMKVLDQIIKQLELENQVATHAGRIEEMPERVKTRFAVVTARALSQLSVLMEMASPLLMTGGQLICYKARVSDEELQHARELQETLGMRIERIRSTYLSDGETFRTILVCQKVGKPRIKLPRQNGFAQKRPL
ncbi:16S rRNA (guanine(527)-N(7))-methyltransferase RsmG [Eggerthellaceae bacterium zg-1084]|uniref:16S rRNA (guanine(527)-N(7))-methyltransferase RsmG n=1 Tax=Berryella wangjianweii TaxID=2734634 RepID=UPI0015570849|nr:16S rRNA (guanine(527)-N(7))-methyltransferase RsmG [Berryella wangjianweii]NPD30933.1 16S rRNA (guanine(527)-N(7))-methyltransferase RsmG [Berryella wangjianweii]NPD31798.1 16S rRNA (guanine(527)-N(7))-methyltransferase RsmG [Eggerthellaceae bacterium zg-997]